MSYPLSSYYLGPVPRGNTLPQFFEVEGVGRCAVKFLNNPQGPRALPNEIVGFGVADVLGLKHPPCGVVEIAAESLPERDQLKVYSEYYQDTFIFHPGLHLYSQWLDDVEEVAENDLTALGSISNPEMMAGVVVLDLLMGNTDRKALNPNLILHREKGGRRMLKVIDLGMCFGNAGWELGNLLAPDLPMLEHPLPYSLPPAHLLDTVKPHTDFGTFCDRLQGLDRVTLKEIVNRIPEAWQVSEEQKRAMVEYMASRAERLPVYLETRARLTSRKWWQ